MYIWAIAIIIILWLVWKFYPNTEQYVSKREKAELISHWWRDTADPEYTKYKEDIPHSDIVEYRRVKMADDKSVDKIEKLIY